MRTIEGRVCRKCGLFKEADRFSIEPKTGNYKYACKDCVNSYFKNTYYPRNREKVIESSESYRVSRREETNARTYEYRSRNLDKAKARQTVGNAVRAGKFTKLPCEVCGEIKSEFHHNNGYEPENYFVGQWLCTPHHKAAHGHRAFKTLQETR